MKLLYIAHRLPYPPNKGEKIRSFNQIKYLAQRHTIHLCSFVDDPDDLKLTPELQRFCASVDIVYRDRVRTWPLAAGAFLKALPLSVSLFYRKALAERILNRITMERIDCVIVSSSSMAQYASSIPRVPKIIDFIDIDSQKWRSYAQLCSSPLSFVYGREGRLLSKYEEEITRSFDHSIVVSGEEQRVLQRRIDDRPVSVISNGVDLEYFAPADVLFDTKFEPTIVFTGAMDYFPNIDAVSYFCNEIFPLVRKAVPRAQFFIVGRNPAQQVKRLANQTNVTVTGTLPDIRPYLRKASVAIAPFRVARGVQNKVLEAMAMGIPVVGTVEAFKGLAATEQDGIRIADDVVAFARHVTNFLRGDSDLRHLVALQTRSYLRQHHRWEDQGAKLERILAEIVQGQTREKAPEVKSGTRT